MTLIKPDFTKTVKIVLKVTFFFLQIRSGGNTAKLLKK